MSLLTNNTQSAPNVFFFATANSPVVTSPLSVLNGTSNFVTQVTADSNTGGIRVDNYPLTATPIGSLSFSNATGVLTSAISLGSVPVFQLTSSAYGTALVRGSISAYDSNTGNTISIADRVIDVNGNGNFVLNDSNVLIQSSTTIDNSNLYVGPSNRTSLKLGSNLIVFQGNSFASNATISYTSPTLTINTSNLYTPNILTNSVNSSGSLTIGFSGTSNVSIAKLTQLSGNGSNGLAIGSNSTQVDISNVANISGNAATLTIGVGSSTTNICNVANISGNGNALTIGTGSSTSTLLNTILIRGNGSSMSFGSNSSDVSMYNVTAIRGNGASMTIGDNSSNVQLSNVTAINGSPYPQLAVVSNVAVTGLSYNNNSGTVSWAFTSPYTLPTSNATYMFQLNVTFSTSGGSIGGPTTVTKRATMDTGSNAFNSVSLVQNGVNDAIFQYTETFIGQTGSSSSITFSETQQFWTNNPSSISATVNMIYFRIA